MGRIVGCDRAKKSHSCVVPILVQEGGMGWSLYDLAFDSSQEQSIWIAYADKTVSCCGSTEVSEVDSLLLIGYLYLKLYPL